MKHLIWCLQILVISTLAATSLSDQPNGSNTCESTSDEQECKNESADADYQSKAVRVVTREELDSKTGENDSEIWLSVLGEVFDVTEGKSFYGKGMSYSGLAGTDCTVCYVTGIFTAEEAAKHTDELSDSMIPGLAEWLGFYGTHTSYKFIGHLIDPRFYDEKGEPTANLVGLRKRISSVKNKQK
mmetsp:Transcript_12559/g.31642  ORF Transcript_12559/g.31642 Transcript_12559/m.31642 type:complete len:185 (+) Transcript_12559:178-732(+)